MTSCSATRKWRRGRSRSFRMPMRRSRSRRSTPSIRRRPSRCLPRPAGPTATATASSTRTARASPSSCSMARARRLTDQLVAYMQDAWKAIGVDATPRALEFPALIEATTTNLDLDVALYGFWLGRDVHPGRHVRLRPVPGRLQRHEVLQPGTGHRSTTRRSGPSTKQARRELLIQATNIVNDEQPVAILYFPQDHAAYSDQLQNFKPSTWGVDLHTSGSNSSFER